MNLLKRMVILLGLVLNVPPVLSVRRRRLKMQMTANLKQLSSLWSPQHTQSPTGSIIMSQMESILIPL